MNDEHSWQWLAKPLTGTSLSSAIASLASVPWAAIVAGVGTMVPALIGAYFGFKERRARFEFEQEKRRLYLAAERKRLEAIPGDQIHPEEFKVDAPQEAQ